MPYVPPADLSAIPKKHRNKLQAALLERAVLAYAFSWKKLSALLEGAGLPPEELQSCIVAYNDEDERKVRDQINEVIAEELAANDLTALRHADPFGRLKDFLLIHSTTSSFSKQTAMDLLVAECRVPAAVVANIWERSTKKSPIIMVQARDAKDRPEDTNGK